LEFFEIFLFWILIPNFLHIIAERGGLSQLPILSLRWSSARTMGSHPNFLHVLWRDLEQLPETLKELEPLQRLKILCKPIPYVLPMVVSVTHKLGEPDLPQKNWFEI